VSSVRHHTLNLMVYTLECITKVLYTEANSQRNKDFGVHFVDFIFINILYC